MDINIGGLISVVIFYIAILLVGIWAGWKGKKNSEAAHASQKNPDEVTTADSDTKLPGQKCSSEEEESMLAGRNIGWVVGSFTMTG